MDSATPLDHESAYASARQVSENGVQVEWVAGVHDDGDIAKPVSGLVGRRTRGIDDLVDVPGREELGVRIEGPVSGQGDLKGAFALASAEACGPPGFGSHQKARVVGADGVR